MKPLICAADDCSETFEFDPVNPLKKFHSVQCQTRMRVRRWRARKHGGGPGGGGKQRRLFAKPMLVKTKPPKPTRVPEPTLFEADLLAQAWRGRRIRAKRAQCPIIPGILSTPGNRKPSKPVQADPDSEACFA